MQRRSDGLYQKKVTIQGKSRIFYGHTVREVEDKIFAAKLTPAPETSQSVRFGFWADRWWSMHQKNIKHNTQVCYAKPLEDCKEYFKNQPINQIKPLDVSAFIDGLCKMGFARQTVKVRLIVLKQICDYAQLNGVISQNPTAPVELPLGLAHKERVGLTSEQIQRVGTGKNLFALFLLYTGLRRNEALAVRWEDIDFALNQIRIDKQVLWRTGAAPEIVDTTKSESGDRVVPLLAPLAECLKKQKNKAGYVFAYHGKLMTKSGYKYLWERVQKDLQLEGVTAHHFRHAYITMLWESGIDVKTAQKLAGHAKVEIMLDIYTHLDKLATKDAEDKLNSFLQKSSKFGSKTEIMAL